MSSLKTARGRWGTSHHRSPSTAFAEIILTHLQRDGVGAIGVSQLERCDGPVDVESAEVACFFFGAVQVLLGKAAELQVPVIPATLSNGSPNSPVDSGLHALGHGHDG